MRTQLYEKNMALGRDYFSNTAKEYGISFNEKELQPFLAQYKQTSVNDFLAAVGAGLIPFREVFNQIHPECVPSGFKRAMSLFKKSKSDSQLDKKMPVTGLISGIALKFGKCCHPVPGDAIVGIVNTGKDVTIHTSDCPTLNQYQDEPERWLDVDWNMDIVKDKVLPVKIKVVLEDKPSALTGMTNIVAAQNIPLTNLTTKTRSNGFSDIVIEVEVKDNNQLDILLQALRAFPHIATVHRLKA